MDYPDYERHKIHPKVIGSAPKFPSTFTQEEVEYLTDPSKMFGKATSKKLDEMLRNKTSTTNDSITKVLYESWIRKDQVNEPPACIICLNKHFANEAVRSRLGCIIWFPQFPKFFAAHEVCMTMCPKVVTIETEETHSVPALLCSITLESICNEIRRTRNMKCVDCGDRLAVIGCEDNRCQKVFHMPCAINKGSHVNFKSFSILCTSHSKKGNQYIHWLVDSFNKLNKKFSKEMGKGENFEFSELLGYGEADEICIICLENMDVREQKPIYERTVVTNCCRERYTHFECMKAFLNSRGLEAKCPHCNSQEKLKRDLFRTQLELQGLSVINVDPDDEGPSNENTPCAAGDSCLCPDGPLHYDFDKGDGNFQSFAPLNSCMGCAAMIHRACAGNPWNSLDAFNDETKDEPQWLCKSCLEFGITQFEADLNAVANGFSPENLELLRDMARQIEEMDECAKKYYTIGEPGWEDCGWEDLRPDRTILQKIAAYNDLQEKRREMELEESREQEAAAAEKMKQIEMLIKKELELAVEQTSRRRRRCTSLPMQLPQEMRQALLDSTLTQGSVDGGTEITAKKKRRSRGSLSKKMDYEKSPICRSAPMRECQILVKSEVLDEVEDVPFSIEANSVDPNFSTSANTTENTDPHIRKGVIKRPPKILIDDIVKSNECANEEEVMMEKKEEEQLKQMAKESEEMELEPLIPTAPRRRVGASLPPLNVEMLHKFVDLTQEPPGGGIRNTVKRTKNARRGRSKKTDLNKSPIFHPIPFTERKNVASVLNEVDDVPSSITTDSVVVNAASSAVITENTDPQMKVVRPLTILRKLEEVLIKKEPEPTVEQPQFQPIIPVRAHARRRKGMVSLPPLHAELKQIILHAADVENRNNMKKKEEEQLKQMTEEMELEPLIPTAPRRRAGTILPPLNIEMLHKFVDLTQEPPGGGIRNTVKRAKNTRRGRSKKRDLNKSPIFHPAPFTERQNVASVLNEVYDVPSSIKTDSVVVNAASFDDITENTDPQMRAVRPLTIVIDVIRGVVKPKESSTNHLT